jgi:hypothetical protein
MWVDKEENMKKYLIFFIISLLMACNMHASSDFFKVKSVSYDTVANSCRYTLDTYDVYDLVVSAACGKWKPGDILYLELKELKKQ